MQLNILKSVNIFLPLTLALGSFAGVAGASSAKDPETLSVEDFAYGKVLLPDPTDADSMLIVTWLTAPSKMQGVLPEIHSVGMKPGEWDVPADLGTGKIVDAIMEEGRLFLLTKTGIHVLSAPDYKAKQLVTISGNPFLTRLIKDGNYLYWMQEGDIYRASESGAGPAQLIAETGDPASSDLNFHYAVDSQYVYWTEFNDIQVKRKANDGSGAAQVIAGKFALDAGPANIEVHAGKIYFTNTNDAANEDIFRMNSDGTGLEKIVSGYAAIRQIAVRGDQLFFVSNGTELPTGMPLPAYFHSLDLSVAQAQPRLVTVLSPFPAAFTLTEDADFMLWTEMTIDFVKQERTMSLKRLELGMHP